MLEKNGQRKRGRTKMTWRRHQVEGSRVKARGSCKSNEMEGRNESDRGGDKVYLATFGDEEKNGLKLSGWMESDFLML